MSSYIDVHKDNEMASLFLTQTGEKVEWWNGCEWVEITAGRAREMKDDLALLHKLNKPRLDNRERGLVALVCKRWQKWGLFPESFVSTATVGELICAMEKFRADFEKRPEWSQS